MPAHTKPYIVTMVLKAESKQPPHEVCHAQSLRTLAISPYASSQEIETALAQQHQLGDIPEPVLALIATTLLSEQQRQAYDQQLMALDNLSHTPKSTEGSLDTNISHYSAAAAAVPPPSETTNNDGIVFYDGMHSVHHPNQIQKSS